MTGQQAVDRAALTHGWIAVGGDNGELVYRQPGTPSWVSIMYAHTGAILWADGQDRRRVSRHFAGIDKVDRLVAFLAGG
ncbi:hypothetical protein [Mycobacteroides abscessus]|uniref:hypothetical protein n=1 Tax=Mycobacteroides abscessus TaxID=36809 RepID=UPI00078D283E|nr:hypothetical protein [Mycobacteroides abscessus]QST89872.1 hypothetical protein PROPHIGD53-3_71 [Mycobacterium phage prophiGD53-3]AMU27712.1 hypothetical protein A3N96_21805 [Mycobacteroides abscessus]MDO3363948.1 hypothetical protein [Mycobacteroides abscessus subsp. massiliense]QSM74002.1 hypothetical protein I2T84_21950 [Mycobacteroides abscessus subsp. massiliense]SKI16805.1 Uncharacterised protein [Mycobacteroides abscessus subsp. massiliense]